MYKVAKSFSVAFSAEGSRRMEKERKNHTLRMNFGALNEVIHVLESV